MDDSRELASWGERALAALPPERRLVQALRLLELMIPNDYRFDLSLRVFRSLPEPALFKLLKREFSDAFSSPDAAEKKQLKAALAELENVAASAPSQPASKSKSRPKPEAAPISLVLRWSLTVKDGTELTAIQQKQIVKAGEAYFEEKRSLKKLLSEGQAEGDSFHDNLELRTLATEDGKTAYDLVYVMGDSGLIFEAGKTKEIAQIVQGGIEGCDDDDLSEALAKGLKLKPSKSGSARRSR